MRSVIAHSSRPSLRVHLRFHVPPALTLRLPFGLVLLVALAAGTHSASSRQTPAPAAANATAAPTPAAAPQSAKAADARPLRELTPRNVFPVNFTGRFEPSGLALVNGELFTVSDKNNEAIFRLVREGDHLNAVAALRIDFIEDTGWIDMEGLVPDGEGGFYVVSEIHSRILRVPASGKTRWVTPSLKPAGQTVGLLTTENAGFEGITLLGPGHFLLAAERNPRGLMEVNIDEPSPSVSAVKWDLSRFPISAPRFAAFADLCVWRGRVFALLRDSGVVCELVRDPKQSSGWREGQAVSILGLEQDPRLRYRDMTYGIAEGMVMDDTTLWLILDNNNDNLVSDPADKRSRLVELANPFRK